ncbi:hypothetical protein HDU92_002304 [Lobulomyces angularis]|nr:hypothetical protein HDU92_002304 [Lobulomyces angularis]
MSLLVFRSLWGIIDENNANDWDTTLKSLKEKGFDGIEASLGDIGGDHETFQKAMKKYDMKLILGIYSSWQDYSDNGWKNVSVEGHLIEWKRQLDLAATLNTFHINSHSGQDTFTLEESKNFFKNALQYKNEKYPQLSLSHETHRSRILYSPWQTLELLNCFPDLELTIDYSHWIVVAERYLDTEFDLKWKKKIAKRCRHIHARVGSRQAPQISHPDDPVYAKEVQVFNDFWKLCLLEMNTAGYNLTLTPEYGPSPYTPMIPFSGKPVSDVGLLIEGELKKWKKFDINSL